MYGDEKATDDLLRIVEFLSAMLKNQELPLQYKRDLFSREYYRVANMATYIGCVMKQKVYGALLKVCNEILDSGSGELIIFVDKYASPGLYENISEYNTNTGIMGCWIREYFIPGNIRKGVFYEESGSEH